MKEPFRCEIPIPFPLVDREGIVFFGHSLALAHQALEAFVPASGIAWKEWFASEEFLVPIRKATADYEAPIVGGIPCFATVVVARLGRTSVTFRCTLSQRDRACVTVETVHVFVARETKTPCAVPPAIAARLT